MSDKYIQIRHWDYWWYIYGFDKEPVSSVEFSLTNDPKGENEYFHFNFYTLPALDRMIQEDDFIGSLEPSYQKFLHQAELLRQGKQDFFIGALYYRDYIPNIDQCSQFLKDGQSIFQATTPQRMPVEGVVFLRESESLTLERLIQWLEKLSFPMFRENFSFGIANQPSQEEAYKAYDFNMGVSTDMEHHEEIELNGCIEVPVGTPLKEFEDAFLVFLESRGWYFGGGWRVLMDGHYINVDNTIGDLSE